MNTDIKQAMHVEAAKSLNAAEANENERRWNETKIDRKNEDPTNHYDKTRMKLNFEIGPDGKIYPLGYHPKSLDVRLQERLSELGWKPFKPDSKIQPNCCARFLFGGNHDRTLQMAFGSQIVNLEKIVPVGVRPKSGRECVMWSAKFGKDRYEYGKILKDMHTSLYEEVGSKYGLERGDSIEGRNVMHLNKRDYIRKLTKEAKQAEKAVKGLQTMMRKLESQISSSQSQLEEIEKSLASGKIALQEYEIQKTRIQKQISECQSKLEDKSCKLQEKEQELEQMTKNIDRVGRVAQPFRNHKIDFEPPRITGKPPIFGVDKWIEEQNRSIASRFVKIVRQIEELYRKDAEQQIQAVQNNALLDYRELKWLQQEYARLTALNDNQTEQMQTFLDQLAEPYVRERIFSIADALIGGQPITVSSGGGGGNSDSDLRWDGRRPDEEEDTYKRRCIKASLIMSIRSKYSYRRR